MEATQTHAIRIYPLSGWWRRERRVREANREMDAMLRDGWSVAGAITLGGCLVVHYVNRDAVASILAATVASGGEATERSDDDWGAS